MVIGGGLTGLSTAYHLGPETAVFEREPVPGGVAGSAEVRGFTFDHTGHLLHFKDPRVERLIEALVPGLFKVWERRASVWRAGVKTEYPFQVNTFGHPPELVSECLVGFIEALKAGRECPDGTFAEWIRCTFGPGFDRHFFTPYNAKFWRRDLSELSADWVSWAIPRPSLKAVVDGALGVVRRGLGYNATFRYPRQGGIGQLADALASRVPGLRLGAELREVDTRARTLRFADGESVPYDRLVSTIPLPRLVAISNLSAADKLLARELDHVGVLNFNLGIAREAAWPDHWTYFPEPDIPFYRLGVPTSFSSGVAPPGTTSYYIEVTYRPEQEPDPEALWPEVLEALVRIGAVRSEREILVRHVVRIPHAYVVFDERRKRVLGPMLAALRACGIVSVGRYGAWEYSSMEKALLDGMDTAAALAAEAAAP